MAHSVESARGAPEWSLPRCSGHDGLITPLSAKIHAPPQDAWTAYKRTCDNRYHFEDGGAVPRTNKPVARDPERHLPIPLDRPWVLRAQKGVIFARMTV